MPKPVVDLGECTRCYAHVYSDQAYYSDVRGYYHAHCPPMPLPKDVKEPSERESMRRNGDYRLFTCPYCGRPKYKASARCQTCENDRRKADKIFR